MKSQFSMLVKA